mmetsp:Transcript_44035/g.116466  ORF Transcript_44035/g.116466 Transcript_44035/m.116466 type:complete len:361 (+) Transcript_44035:748-1830(+)
MNGDCRLKVRDIPEPMTLELIVFLVHAAVWPQVPRARQNVVSVKRFEHELSMRNEHPRDHAGSVRVDGCGLARTPTKHDDRKVLVEIHEIARVPKLAEMHGRRVLVPFILGQLDLGQRITNAVRLLSGCDGVVPARRWTPIHRVGAQHLAELADVEHQILQRERSRGCGGLLCLHTSRSDLPIVTHVEEERAQQILRVGWPRKRQCGHHRHDLRFPSIRLEDVTRLEGRGVDVKRHGHAVHRRVHNLMDSQTVVHVRDIPLACLHHCRPSGTQQSRWLSFVPHFMQSSRQHLHPAGRLRMVMDGRLLPLLPTKKQRDKLGIVSQQRASVPFPDECCILLPLARIQVHARQQLCNMFHMLH